MIEATIHDAGPAGNSRSYFRRLLEARPDLLEARRNDELLARWLRDHPTYPMVPATVKKSLGNLKCLMRKQQREARSTDDFREVQTGPEEIGPGRTRSERLRATLCDQGSKRTTSAKATIHDRSADTDETWRETLRDGPGDPSQCQTPTHRSFAGELRVALAKSPKEKGAAHQGGCESSATNTRAADRPAISLYQAMGQSGREPRLESRQPFEMPLLAIPVLPDGAPDWDHRVIGKSLDLSRDGMGLVVGSPLRLSTTSLVLILQHADGNSWCAGLEVQHDTAVDKGIRIGGSLSGYADELLRPESLTPTFDAGSMSFALRFSQEVLDKWARVGILQAYVWDRIALCPDCYGLPTFRKACASCGSVALASDKFIHHFACANVDVVEAFEDQEELVCPKCHLRPLVVGSDYEYITGPYRCQECNWTDMELEYVGQCLKCDLRFPGYQAHEQDLRGYRAQRLDPLAFLASSRSAAGLPGSVVVDGRASLRA
jgi:hypothetical protein